MCVKSLENRYLTFPSMQVSADEGALNPKVKNLKSQTRKPNTRSETRNPKPYHFFNGMYVSEGNPAHTIGKMTLDTIPVPEPKKGQAEPETPKPLKV